MQSKNAIAIVQAMASMHIIIYKLYVCYLEHGRTLKYSKRYARSEHGDCATAPLSLTYNNMLNLNALLMNKINYNL